MIWIVLATGLCTANFTFVALLFRRERRLSRQLSDMRAERNSEWILHALQGVPDERERTAPAVNGDFQPTAAGPEPVRRKRHLGLYLGGGSAAALAVWRTFRRAGQRNPSLVMAGVAGAATVATVAVALTGGRSGGNSHSWPPTSTQTVTVTATPSQEPGGRPSAAPTTSPASPGAPASPGTIPAPSGAARRSPRPAARTPGGEASSGAGLPPTASGAPSSRPPNGPPATGPSATPSPSMTPGRHTRCLDVDVASVLDLAICLAGGG